MVFPHFPSLSIFPLLVISHKDVKAFFVRAIKTYRKQREKKSKRRSLPITSIWHMCVKKDHPQGRREYIKTEIILGRKQIAFINAYWNDKHCVKLKHAFSWRVFDGHIFSDMSIQYKQFSRISTLGFWILTICPALLLTTNCSPVFLFSLSITAEGRLFDHCL